MNSQVTEVVLIVYPFGLINCQLQVSITEDSGHYAMGYARMNHKHYFLHRKKLLCNEIRLKQRSIQRYSQTVEGKQLKFSYSSNNKPHECFFIHQYVQIAFAFETFGVLQELKFLVKVPRWMRRLLHRHYSNQMRQHF